MIVCISAEFWKFVYLHRTSLYHLSRNNLGRNKMKVGSSKFYLGLHLVAHNCGSPADKLDHQWLPQMQRINIKSRLHEDEISGYQRRSSSYELVKTNHLTAFHCWTRAKCSIIIPYRSPYRTALSTLGSLSSARHCFMASSASVSYELQYIKDTLRRLYCRSK